MIVPIVPDATDVQAGSASPAAAILARLRTETRDAHKELERVLDLMGIALTRDIYCQRLGQYYGFYGPLEAELRLRCALPSAQVSDASSLTASLIASLVPRLHKTLLLQQDLQQLQVSTDELPRCHDLPSLDTPAEVLGCLYVLEGATLGGRMIAQHVHATLGITASTGGSFFEGYAGDTGKMWHAMRHILSTCAVDIETEHVIVANANATFTCLRRWCQPVHVTSTDRADRHARAHTSA